MTDILVRSKFYALYITFTPAFLPDWCMQLNNILQANRALGKVAYELSPVPGTKHQPPWTAVATS